LGSAAASDSRSFQPGDAGGHAALDLEAINQRQDAALARVAGQRWHGDAAGFAATDLRTVNERQAAGIVAAIGN
jgi:hypothetical protein